MTTRHHSLDEGSWELYEAGMIDQGYCWVAFMEIYSHLLEFIQFFVGAKLVNRIG